MDIETFLSYGEKKRLEFLTEMAASMFKSNNFDSIQFWLNLYDTMHDFQSGRARGAVAPQKDFQSGRASHAKK